MVNILEKKQKRSENIYDFEKFLTALNPKFLLKISEREIVDIFNKFKEGTFQAYIDSLPSVKF